MIGEVRAACAEVLDGEPYDLSSFELELGDSQNRLQDLQNLPSAPSVTTLQHPDELAEDDAADESRLVGTALPLNEISGQPRLLRIVLNQVADQDVGVNPLQCPPHGS